MSWVNRSQVSTSRETLYYNKAQTVNFQRHQSNLAKHYRVIKMASSPEW